MAPPAEAHRIFFSHRHRDEPVTKEIISILHRHTENVRCFISEHIERGAKWRSAIAEQLKLSGFLVLVFTDPEEDWGWCLYETGFFDALSQASWRDPSYLLLAPPFNDAADPYC